MTQAKRLERVLFGVAACALLLLAQVLTGRVGHRAAALLPLEGIDPDGAFAALSVHHAVQMLLGIALIVVLGRLLHFRFYFQRGDSRVGLRYLGIYAAAFAAITLITHGQMALSHQLPRYAYPLDTRNVLGTLAFQLFLSGPAEEVIYRALPVGVLCYAFGASVPLRGRVTLEIVLASALFALAHATWSLSPWSFQADAFQLAYAFALGTIQGVAYQHSKSILYPILMHSVSNVLMVGGGYLFTALMGGA